MTIRFFIKNNVWYVFAFAMIPFLAPISACHIQVFVFGMIPSPRKSAVTENLNFDFLNFTENYVTTVRFFELFKVSGFDAL